MIDYLGEFPLVLMLIFTLGMVFSRQLIKCLIYFSLFSIVLSLKYFLFHAPDVALTEASLGAGLTTIIFLIAIKKTRK